MKSHTRGSFPVGKAAEMEGSEGSGWEEGGGKGGEGEEGVEG